MSRSQGTTTKKQSAWDNHTLNDDTVRQIKRIDWSNNPSPLEEFIIANDIQNINGLIQGNRI